MAIRGSLREASLPDVLQLLAMGKKTGCLSVTHRDQFGSIYFDRGRICYALIVNRRDRLGDLLLHAGLIAQHELDAAVAAQEGQTEHRLGDILVAQGRITRDELNAQMRVQIEEAVYYLFTWSNGTFNFEADVRPDDRDMLVAINPESLLLEGARRVDEWELITKRITSFDLIYQVDRDRVRESGVTLTASQEKLMLMLDGRRDIAAVIDASGLGEFEVGKSLYALSSAGFLHRVGRTQTLPAPVAETRVEEHRNLGIAFYKTGMLDEAMREFRRVLELRAGDVPTLFYVSLVSMRRGEWQRAVSSLREAADDPEVKAAVFHNLAYAYERLGDYEAAQAVLDQALLRGGETDPRTRTTAGVLALRRGALREAAAAFEAARPLWGRRAPAAAWFHYAALTAALLGETPRAEALLVEGLGHHPRAGALYNNLATVQERRGRTTEAAATIERGMHEDPTLPQLHKNAGDYAYRAGQYDDALDAFQRAARLHKTLGDDLFLKMGNIHYRRGEREDAIGDWERALAINPQNEIVRSNIEAARRSMSQGVGRP